jgi:CHAT domain-containing protein/Tfp pilus assembly protein PilF
MRRIAVCCALIWAGILPLYAQQSGSPSVAPSVSQIPAGVQARLEKLQAALGAAQVSGDRKAQAITLTRIATVYSDLGEKQKALDLDNQALSIYRALGDSDGEANTLNYTGMVYSDLGENQKALELYNQALPLFRAVGDSRNQADTLSNIGAVYSDLGETEKALDFLNQALPLHRAAGNRSGEAATLDTIGAVYSALGQQQKALDSYNQALLIYRAVGDRDDEAMTLNNIGEAYFQLGELQKALALYNQAMPIKHAMGDRDGEAIILGNLGEVYSDLGDKQKALDLYGQALPLFHAVSDRAGEATALNNIAQVYSGLGENRKALDVYNQALPLHRAVGNHSGEAITLNNIGAAYSGLGEKQKALDLYNQALALYRAVGDRSGEAMALNNIGEIYSDLGDKQNALVFFTQARTLHRAVGDRKGEATALTNMANVYSGMGEKRKALDLYNQALSIDRAVGNRGGEAVILANIGEAYYDLGETEKALDFLNQSLVIKRAVGDRSGEAGTLTNLANIYSDLGEQQKALDLYNQALPIATAIHDPLLEAVIFRALMTRQKQQPALATFYGKQAVNLLQQVRGNLQGLDQRLQSSFLASKGKYYRDLADLLIAQGRLPEAEQVLDLLKQQEYSDYTRGEIAKTGSPLTLTPAEDQAQQDYQKSTVQLVSIGEQWSQLKKIASRTSEQESQYQQLSAQLDAASKDLNDYYSRLYVLFGKNSSANNQVEDVTGNVSSLRQQIGKMPDTVALYTMVTGDRYRVIVVTGATIFARELSISDQDLNKKVSDFQQVLRNPARDPRPLAGELYKILVEPVKPDLDQAHAHTLVWSLDGVLRYIPMAALYDGKQYLVENYSTVTITPASIPHLSEKPDVSSLSAVAMGISRKYEDGLNPLPSVVGELDDVVKDAQVQGANGVLQGTILLDGQFTETAMENQLGGPHSVVHIASHFVFKPGDDNQSYLLLAGKDEAGSGYHLTVADFRDNQKLSLDDTDLLTLSACETGMSGNASNGREVDGLGTTAQLKGAKAVISSLWSVDDASTGLLMADFYKRWADGAGKVAKVEALRQAQLDLLLGKVTPQAGSGGRGFSSEGSASETPKGYAHPFYWAPFVLMGNWR